MEVSKFKLRLEKNLGFELLCCQSWKGTASAHIVHVWIEPTTFLLCFALLLLWITEPPAILWPSKAQLLVLDSSSVCPNQPRVTRKKQITVRLSSYF